MSMTGPIPKRSEERRRENKGVIPIETIDVSELIKREVEIPVEDENWEPVTKMWFRSLARSAAAIFFEPSDWASAWLGAEFLDQHLKPQEVKVGQTGSAGMESGGGEVLYIYESKRIPLPPAVMATMQALSVRLMMTEGDRRRLRYEVNRANATAGTLVPDDASSISATREGLV